MVRDWRKPRYVPRSPTSSRCPLCGERSRRIVNEPETYAELLGLYLGDGDIDILDLFESTCRSLGLSPRRYARSIRPNRREEIAALLANVGVKSCPRSLP